MFAKVIQFIRVKTRSKAVLVGVAAVALALGLGLAPAAGFFGRGESQMSARLSAQASGPSAQGSGLRTQAPGVSSQRPGVRAQASQGSQGPGNSVPAAGLRTTNGTTVTGLLRGVLSPGSGSGAREGAQKFDLLGPAGNAFCDGSGVLSGAPGNFGFAIINAPANKTVEATVYIEKQTPNTLYLIRLVQGQSDCFTVDTTVMTNKQGNATVHFSEPSTSSHALIVVDTPVLGVHFVTKTYFHS